MIRIVNDLIHKQNPLFLKQIHPYLLCINLFITF
jgi:hypothetical protein